jgi:hypothetical protein
VFVNLSFPSFSSLFNYQPLEALDLAQKYKINRFCHI